MALEVEEVTTAAVGAARALVIYLVVVIERLFVPLRTTRQITIHTIMGHTMQKRRKTTISTTATTTPTENEGRNVNKLSDWFYASSLAEHYS